MPVPLLHVDAFADGPFRGNPAAVCLLDGARPPAWMQSVAAELNLPATVFVEAARAPFGLRWFSPVAELALCGHGTLAAAHALWDTARLPPGAAARFAARSGELAAVSRDGWIALQMPAEIAAAAAPAVGLLDAIGVKARWVGRNRLDYVIEVDDEAMVRAVVPDLVALAAIETRGVIVTARAATDGVDFVSRFFAPRAGIPEDAVTGSAHCCLAPLWASRLGRSRLTARQLSARGGVVRAEVDADRVILSGQAVTIARGELL
ncbi:MAG TPA: PhzF family phenazine biosynthesis protein [Methylomirabilota bacterium]|jgi:predicted PhzF superfamily epimerase YddE/YHI9